MARAAQREARQRALARFRLGTRLAREDLDVLAQRLEDCPPWLDGEASAEWKRAATAHGAARAALQDASSLRDVIGVHLTLREAWFRLARADAFAFDESPPTSSEPCFFNPQHGPAAVEAAWAPPGREPGRCRSAVPTPPGSPRASRRCSGAPSWPPCSRRPRRAPTWSRSTAASAGPAGCSSRRTRGADQAGMTAATRLADPYRPPSTSMPARPTLASAGRAEGLRVAERNRGADLDRQQDDAARGC